MPRLSDIAGKICEIAIPIKHDIYYGNQDSAIAVCTLSNIDLLLDMAKSELMRDILLVARLFSENKGIETLVRYALRNSRLKYIVLCGNDTKGHLPGQALLSLKENGINSSGRIIGAKGKDPILSLSMEEVDQFRNRIILINLIGINDVDRIIKQITNLRTK